MIKKKNKTSAVPIRQGDELQEIKNNLSSSNLEVCRQTVRKIISGMTLGKDVSSLFPLIIKNIETPNMELKKLIYLYIINYSKQYPDMTIMAVNSFQKDGLDMKNPFTRGLAVRTMGCLRIKGIIEYLKEPLKSSLYDSDAYVRKTGILCVAKLFDSHPGFIKDEKLIDAVTSALKDGNPMVVTNAIQCLLSIEEKGGPKFELDFEIVNRFLTGMDESNEWGQVIFLDAIARYQPENSQQAERILDRVQARILSKNSAVVLSAIKVLMIMLDNLDDPHAIRSHQDRIAQSLTSFTSREKEIKYVALKNTALIAENRPAMLCKYLEFFFCNYSDPFYIKEVKLKIIVTLANEENIDQILLQLKDNISEIDVEFVRLCLRTIGKLAIKIPASADKCVHALVDSLERKSNLILQETIIVMKDVFRKYPTEYVSLLGKIFNNLQQIDEPQAKAALVWIFGQYIEYFQNPEEYVDRFFLNNFLEEPQVVQLQILTASVRLYLYNPKQWKHTLEEILKMLDDIEDVDLRRRATFYQNLITSDIQTAKEIMFSEKALISDDGYTSPLSIAGQVYPNLVTTASIYNQLPEQFIGIKKEFDDEQEQAEDSYQEEYEMNNVEGDIPNEQQYYEEDQTQNNYLEEAMNNNDNGFDDFQTQQQQEQNAPNLVVPFTLVQDENTPGNNNQIGLRVETATQLQYNQMILQFKVTNFTNQSIGKFQTKFNNNSYCFRPIQPNIDNLDVVNPQETKIGQVQIDLSGNPSGQNPTNPIQVQVALSTSIGIYVFYMPVYFTVLLRYPKEYDQPAFEQLLKQPNVIQHQASVPYDQCNEVLQNQDLLIQKFTNNNFQYVGSQVKEDKILMLFVTSTVDGVDLPLRVLVKQNSPTLALDYRVYHPSHVELFYTAIKMIVSL